MNIIPGLLFSEWFNRVDSQKVYIIFQLSWTIDFDPVPIFNLF